MVLPLRSRFPIAVFLILFVGGFAVHAQPATEFGTKVFDFLNEVPSTEAPPFFSRGLGHTNYLPAEAHDPRLIHFDPTNHVVKTSEGVFVLLDGTGRVFKVMPDRLLKYRFFRLDSTHLSGYNNGAFVFSFRDTIFSLGGYGFWHFNGQLRYYRAQSSGWEVLLLNRRVQVRWPDFQVFLDRRNEAVWYLNRINLVEAFKGSGHELPGKEENMVFRLDLNRKIWETIGEITPGFLPLANEVLVIANTPWGPLMQHSPPDRFRTLLADYSANKVFELSDQRMIKSIQSAVSNKEGFRRNNPVTQYYRDTLHILSANGSRSSFRLTLADFKDTGLSIYTPRKTALNLTEGSSWSTFAVLLTGLMGGVLVSWLYFRRQRVTEKEEGDEPEVFTPWENKILLAFQARSDHMLTVEEMDELLETTKRTKEVQNQRRSAITRSINHKYSLLSGDSENLIVSRRQEMDRRMVQYYFSAEKFKAIKQVAGNGTSNG